MNIGSMEDVNENYLRSVMTSMKILVDDMPKDRDCCPWLVHEYAKWWHPECYVCTYASPEVVCNGTDACPFFMSFKDYMNKPVVGSDGTIGI